MSHMRHVCHMPHVSHMNHPCHGEQLSFSCVRSKVIVCHTVICHKWFFWTLVFNYVNFFTPAPPGPVTGAFIELS